MIFGRGKIGMVTLTDGRVYDLAEEPSTIGCNAGFAHAGAIDELGINYTVFFKLNSSSDFGLIPWNAERAAVEE